MSIPSYSNSPPLTPVFASIVISPGLISDDGAVTDPTTEEFLRSYLQEFQVFIERVHMVLPRNP
jgi:chromate reductase